MPATGLPVVSAAPCTAASPIRIPVNEPGPVTTANTSMSRSLRAARAAISASAPGRRVPCARASWSASVIHVPSAWRARLPARVTVSSARTTTAAMLYSAPDPAFSPLFPLVTTSPLPSSASATPAMRQYLDVKRQHRDAIVFFRMGDFYEMFYEDALAAARVLELTLTSRAKDASGGAIPMCGIPFHAADVYISRLVRKGYRVAICDQVEDPRKAKGIVRREVTRVVSPGTFTDASYLDAREPAFLAAIAAPASPQAPWGLAFLDVSTGEFGAAEFAGAGAALALAADLAVLRPREVLLADDAQADEVTSACAQVRVTRVDSWTFEPVRARERLCEQLRIVSLQAHGMEDSPAAIAAAGAVVAYLRDTQRGELSHVRDISRRVLADAVLIDPVTLRHLNVIEGVDGGRDGSLLEALDRTATSMGGRLLRQWLTRPLVALARIQDRLDAVEDRSEEL